MKNNNCSKMPIKEIEKVLIKIGIEIAKKGEGALFVISDGLKYKNLLKQRIEPFSVFDEGARKILLSIAMIDGAVIISHDGIMKDYGVKINSKKVFKGYGTRHAAAFSASFEKDTIPILISQEEKKIKIFKKGKIIAQIDALERNVERNVDSVQDVLESIGVGAISTIGVAAVAPALGIAVVPGILVFGVPYYLFKKIKEKW